MLPVAVLLTFTLDFNPLFMLGRVQRRNPCRLTSYEQHRGFDVLINKGLPHIPFPLRDTVDCHNRYRGGDIPEVLGLLLEGPEIPRTDQ